MMTTTTNTDDSPSSTSLAPNLQQPGTPSQPLTSQPSPNTDTPLPLLGGTSSTSRFQRRRKGHRAASTSKDDETMNAWMLSQIAANTVRAELDAQKLKVLKLQEQEETVWAELDAQKLKVLKLQEHKLMLEVQQLQLQTLLL